MGYKHTYDAIYTHFQGITNNIYGVFLLLRFFIHPPPVHPYLCPSIFVFTRPNDGWTGVTGLYIKLCLHPKFGCLSHHARWLDCCCKKMSWWHRKFTLLLCFSLDGTTIILLCLIRKTISLTTLPNKLPCFQTFFMYVHTLHIYVWNVYPH